MALPIEDRLRKFYGKAILPWVRRIVPTSLRKRTAATVYGAVGYRTLLSLPSLSLREKVWLIATFLRIDRNIEHAHRPCEIVAICNAFFRQPSIPQDVFVEAGCWKGGSTAKFSAICALRGTELFVYDSFEGVEPNDQVGYDYTGEYAAAQEEVVANVRRFGCLEVCSFFPGWFKDTIQACPPHQPVSMVYIDCDLASGTREVLHGVVPTLVHDGIVFTQDYHIPAVKDLLHDPSTWQELGVGAPRIVAVCHNTAALYFNDLQASPSPTATSENDVLHTSSPT